MLVILPFSPPDICCFITVKMSLISQIALQKCRLEKAGADDGNDAGMCFPVAVDAEVGKESRLKNHNKERKKKRAKLLEAQQKKDEEVPQSRPSKCSLAFGDGGNQLLSGGGDGHVYHSGISGQGSACTTARQRYFALLLTGQPLVCHRWRRAYRVPVIIERRQSLCKRTHFFQKGKREEEEEEEKCRKTNAFSCPFGKPVLFLRKPALLHLSPN
jgi:hypothetical protein